MWQSIDPWRDISTPSKHSSISARRVDPEHPFNFFWGRDVRGRPLLALEVSSSVEENGNVPKIRGFEVLCTLDKDAGKLKLIISLRERENIELFHRFCMDLMDAVRSLADEAAAFNIVLRRV
ncbi:MAG: PD-(D/E)XK motif protein [Candidatus Thiodiazotropha sp. (ex Lucinoma borealis)]|nr:PD-(D/E)XK motif protein [Candidatus Thiodiazotropha sp. (ex Lucinoma borealis)]